jgi:glyoxylase-like metal-dependent hydrolase (beta-lactamase superfamily II)
MSGDVSTGVVVAWREVCPGVWRAQDSCNVYALVGPGGSVIVDAGSGAWLDHIDDLPKPPVALLGTHDYRVHSAGAVRAAMAGIPVYVPEYEEAIFADPVMHHQQRTLDCTFDVCYWNHFTPIEPVSVAGVLRDYDVVRLGGLDLEIVPLAGAAISQIGISVDLPVAGTVLACGETIHSPGRIPRMAPLQQVYADLEGAVMVYASLRELRRRQVDVLLPSLGEPILEGVQAALEATQNSVRAAVERRGKPPYLNVFPVSAMLDLLDGPDIEQISDHLYSSTQADSKSWFLISSGGKVMAIDYGYYMGALNWDVPGRAHTRRMLLHSLDGLQQVTGKRGIDVVVPTHLHDDHAGAVTLLNRVFGTKVWAGQDFADVLENPWLYNIACIWPQKAKVDLRLATNSTFTWEEYSFHVGPRTGGHSGHQVVFWFEADDLVFAVVGDEWLGERLWYPEAGHSWENDRWDHFFSYHQGASLKGFQPCAQWLLALRPDYILNGHQTAIRTSDLVFQRLQEWLDYFDETHRRVMPVGDADVHFDISSQGGQLRPYRQFLTGPGELRFSATVCNPLPEGARLEARLVGPGGLAGSPKSVDVEAHGRADLELRMNVEGPWRRQPVALELAANGRPFGQVAEAVVTVGHERW